MSAALRILLGVSGGIAAYKSADLVRRLRERGHEVRCALTRSATAFISPLTLEVLSGHKVYEEEYLAPTGTGAELHIEAAAWADALCVAPATAHLLARLALGLGDDFLTTTALAFEGPLVLAPAMHSAMWRKASTQGHVATLVARAARLVGPLEGPLASGEVGMGRMADPAAIVEALEQHFSVGALQGRRIVVSAGPTHEPLDPVRFLGNRSSGKMGFALAEEAARRGAQVLLVAGPVRLPTPPGVERVDVTTAREMDEVLRLRVRNADLVIMAAAVADFRPRNPAPEKIKKEEGDLPVLELEENPDIVAGLRDCAPAALIVGFAAETSRLAEHARAKLERKRLDLLVANDVSRPDIGFESDQNEVTIFYRDAEPRTLSRRPKREIAGALLDLFAARLAEDRSHAPRAL